MRHIGLSNVTLDQLVSARDMVDVVSVQNRCSLFDTTSLVSGLLQHCERARILFIAYSPLGGRRAHQRLLELPQLKTLAEKHDCTVHQLGLAFLLNLSRNLLPIPGARSPIRTVANAEATAIALSDSDLRMLFSLPK